MTTINKREDILPHEDPEYIKTRPDWVIGRIPDLCDYRKLSVDSMEEAFTLAKLGQSVAARLVPTVKGEPLRLYFTQAMIVGAAMITREMADRYHLDFEKYRSVLMVCPSRYGKLIKYDTPVITIEGWKKHGELIPGKDYVFHPDGHPIQVLATKPGKTTHKIHFQNGQVIECHANHEWRVWDRTWVKVGPRPKRKVLKRGRYEVLETKEMIERNYLQKDIKGCRPKFLVDPPKALQFRAKDQPLDPYFFGCWLGDGTSKKPILTLSPRKAEHILPNIPYKVTSAYALQGCSSYHFSHQNILDSIHSLGCFNDKHIPDCYKYGSPEQQKALLAGIIDADGCVDKAGRVIISCANDKLAKDIMELLTIMGECPYETIVSPTTSSSGVVRKKTVHQIGYQPSYALPTKYKKLSRLEPHRKIGIVKIEPVEHGEDGNCIQVDSPDGLYLVGESLVPTHNSFLNAICCIGMAGASGKEVQIGAAVMPKAEIIQGKIVELLPNACEAIQAGLIVTDDKNGEDKFKKIKRLATQVSKDSLKWTNGGSIGLFSTNETRKNADVAAAGAIGIGGDYAVFDEVQMMTPVGFRTASRFMVESPDTKRFCVGNPMINGHFKELYDDPDTFVIHMNEVTGIIEGRFTRKGIKKTGIPSYSPEYRYFIETEFPDERSGSRFFTTLPDVYDAAKYPTPIAKHYYMGIDSAYQGGDGLIVTILSLNQASGQTWVVVEEQVDVKQKYKEWGPTTTMEISLDILKMWEKYNVEAGCIDIGMGIHIYERMVDLVPDLKLVPINYASKPTEWRVENDYNAKFALNKRSELHLDLRDLCASDLVHIAPSYYEELVRQMSEVGQCPAKQKVQIESKKDIKGRLGRSPDHLDSACLAIHAMVLSGVLSAGQEEDSLMEVL